MGDAVIFALLFATYGVHGRQHRRRPAGRPLFDLHNAGARDRDAAGLSITFGFAIAADGRGNRRPMLAWLRLTFLLGQAFVVSRCASSAA